MIPVEYACGPRDIGACALGTMNEHDRTTAASGVSDGVASVSDDSVDAGGRGNYL